MSSTLQAPEVVMLRPLAVRLATAASMLEVSLPLVYQWLRDGRLASIRVGADQRIPIAELERFVREDRGGVVGVLGAKAPKKAQPRKAPGKSAAILK